MPRKQFFDVAGGDPITYDVVTDDGYRLCPFFTSEEETQGNFDSVAGGKACRDDDILLVSYPKAGANWLWEIVTLLLAGSSEVTDGIKTPGMLEMRPGAEQAALPSPRILDTHLNFRYIPKEAREKRLKTILVCRNPRDTVVSFYHGTVGVTLYNYDGKFDNYLQMFMRGEVDYGSYPEYLLEWQQAIRDNPDWPIHIVYYEDLKENCAKEIMRLCTHLGRSVDPALVEQIADNCRFDAMKATKLEKRGRSKFYKGDWHYLRKGVVGDWKNEFTVAQNEAFEKWWADSTRALDMFTFRYEG